MVVAYRMCKLTEETMCFACLRGCVFVDTVELCMLFGALIGLENRTVLPIIDC